MDTSALAAEIAAKVTADTSFWVAVVGLIGVIAGAIIAVLGSIVLHWLQDGPRRRLEGGRKELLLQMLRDGAEALEILTGRTLELMNRGATLDEILHAVTVPAGYLEKPYLRPKYDDSEFLVRGIYHFYAGWFDGNPAHLKPARTADLASELARLAGGADRLAGRAAVLSEAGQTRLALHLAEFAAAAAPDEARIQAIRAAVLGRCIDSETSLMGKAFLAVYQRDAEQRSRASSGGDPPR